MTYRLALVFEDVADTKLTDSSFWFAVGRMQVWPSEAHNAKQFYEVLLPHLNNRTLAATIAFNSEPGGPVSVPWAVPPQSGDPSAVHLLHEALRFVLARRGFTVSPAAPALPRADRRHRRPSLPSNLSLPVPVRVLAPPLSLLRRAGHGADRGARGQVRELEMWSLLIKWQLGRALSLSLNRAPPSSAPRPPPAFCIP
jgi:hypothetical protein